MPGAPINRDLLVGYEGRHISTICIAVRFVDDNQNHCAHFVNHVLAFAEPLTCGQLLGRPGAAANIRVHETFAKCPTVGLFEQRPPDAACLAFVTMRSAVDLAAHTMANVPKKHIGIFCDGEIWHYSNSDRRVIRQTPEQFARHFSGDGFATFFGTFPSDARARVAPAPAAASAVTAPELRRGQVDNIDVAVWQQFLIIRQFLVGADVHSLLDGNFGAMTEEATEAFQVSAGLDVTGVVDAATNDAAIARGFIPRTGRVPRTPISHVTPAMTEKALEVLHDLSSTSVFYTEQLADADGDLIVARLEPHKHTEGTQLRYWHRGVTIYPSQEQEQTMAEGVSSAPEGYAGMDTSVYPGDDVMAHLRSTTNLVWTGFYLGPAPSHPGASWMHRRAVLMQQGWGLAPVYVGQQDSGPGSHLVDGAHGEADGNHAVSLAREAGFPANTVIYVDIETGGPLSPAMTEYLQRWCARVHAQSFVAGAYLSYTTASSALIAVPSLKLWVFRIKTADANGDKDPPFRTDPPSASGTAEASAWQWAQNCRIPKPGGRVLVDLNVAAQTDPSQA